MAYFRIEYFSKALHRSTSFEMMIPNDYRWEEEPPKQPMRTLFLLHGYTGKSGNWVPEELARKYHFAIVMPTAENSFYLDGLSTGHQYQTMVGVELVDYVRSTFGLARGAQDTCIAGMSMGGFGALHTALSYPDRFGKAGALSSALIVHGISGMKPGEDNGMANYAYYHECFGDLDSVEERDCNPEVLVKKLLAAGEPLPAMHLCCGTEDFLLENNRAFHRFLCEQGVAHVYRESSGQHDMAYWQKQIVPVVEWMFGG